MPTKKENNGERNTYSPYITFLTNAAEERFRKQVLDCFDEWYAENPEMEMEPLITENEEMPF